MIIEHTFCFSAHTKPVCLLYVYVKRFDRIFKVVQVFEYNCVIIELVSVYFVKVSEIIFMKLSFFFMVCDLETEVEMHYTLEKLRFLVILPVELLYQCRALGLVLNLNYITFTPILVLLI